MLQFDNGDRILFTGDSITDAGRKRPVGEGLWEGVGTGYVRMIDTFLSVFYPEKVLHVMNTGISGDTSKGLLARYQEDVLSLQPDWVSVLIGVNDVWRQFDMPGDKQNHISVDEYENNVRLLIEGILPHVKGLFLMTPYYMEINKMDAMRAKMDQYGEVIKRLADEYKLPCIDLQKVFVGYLQYRHSAYIMWDRVHPGWIGSMLIANAFLKAAGFDKNIFTE